MAMCERKDKRLAFYLTLTRLTACPQSADTIRLREEFPQSCGGEQFLPLIGPSSPTFAGHRTWITFAKLAITF